MQLLVGILNTFSFLMIVLIAIDRYAHMRYLERYSSIVMKRHGHLKVAAFFVASTINGILLLATSESELAIIQVIYPASVCLFL